MHRVAWVLLQHRLFFRDASWLQVNVFRLDFRTRSPFNLRDLPNKLPFVATKAMAYATRRSARKAPAPARFEAGAASSIHYGDGTPARRAARTPARSRSKSQPRRKIVQPPSSEEEESDSDSDQEEDLSSPTPPRSSRRARSSSPAGRKASNPDPRKYLAESDAILKDMSFMPSLGNTFLLPLLLICSMLLGAPTKNFLTGEKDYNDLMLESVPDTYGFGHWGVGIDRGEKDSRDLLVFVHGWPDNAHVWDNQIDYFCGGSPFLGPTTSDKGVTTYKKPTEKKSKGKYRCVALEMPGSELQPPPGKAALSPDYDFDVLAAHLNDGILNAQASRADRDNTKQPKTTVISHDWGAWITYMAEKENKGIIDSMVALDVGPGAGKGEPASWAASE